MSNIMKVTILGLFVCTLALALAAPESNDDKGNKEYKLGHVQTSRDKLLGCFDCADDVNAAWKDCQDADDILQCILDLLNGLGECAGCVCDLLPICQK